MKKVFIQYNPYKLETDIKIDGEKLKADSTLGGLIVDKRLQEWVECLPEKLVKESNNDEFEVEFHGTRLDYEDLKATLIEARDKGTLKKVEITHKPGKEVADKEARLAEVFTKIQKGPFDDFRDQEIAAAFEQAKSNDFEVCVVATMSAGKSTLINALLGTKLMPSKSEACTATITRIKDDLSANKKTDTPFKAEAYDKDGNLIETHEKLTCSTMERLNSNEEVSEIKVSGNIPFVSSEDISLVLVDTPGSNNARDPSHKKMLMKWLDESSKALVLYIMPPEGGTDDDKKLLEQVAQSMKKDGKLSRDRFIFVVNKLDQHGEEDGDMKQKLDGVRAYIENHGISNPNLFPASALSALQIRQRESGELTEEGSPDTWDEIDGKIKIANRNATGNRYLEAYATLPQSIRNEINEKTKAARSEWEAAGKPEHKNPEEALIHTGVVSIEAAIRQYVQKYAKTAKIKSVVDTFTGKFGETAYFEHKKQELAANQKKGEETVKETEKEIDAIKEKMDNAENAKEFKKAVDGAVRKMKEESKVAVEDIVQSFQARATKRIDESNGKQFDIAAAEHEFGRLTIFARELEPEFEFELDKIIRSAIVKMNEALVGEYKKKLASLADEMDAEGISIDPLKLMGGSVTPNSFSAKKLIKEKDIEDGEVYVKNTDKKWYKPWTWPQESGYYHTVFKTVRYIDGRELTDGFAPIIGQIEGNGDVARDYASEQAEKISEWFEGEFERLDTVLKQKLTELKDCATDKEKAEECVEESKRNLKWLEKIEEEIESILAI